VEAQVTTTQAALDDARDVGFTMGTIAALAVIYGADNPVTWAEVLRCAGVQKVLRHALTHEGDWEWGGFAKYAANEVDPKELRSAKAWARRVAAKSQPST
jgi:hypothetical protein